jgi:hypothetical protein
LFPNAQALLVASPDRLDVALGWLRPEQLPIARLALFDRSSQAAIQLVRGQQRILGAERIAPVTRPGIIRRMLDHALRAHRV